MPHMNACTQHLVGAWRLESCVLKTTSGNAVGFLGGNLAGLLIYLPNGYMSVHVSDQGRPKFADSDFLSGSASEIKSAYEGYISYFGRYEYKSEEGIVLHHVTESLFPNWSGVTHTRFVRLDRDKLIIKTPAILLKKEECSMELVWTRL